MIPRGASLTILRAAQDQIPQIPYATAHYPFQPDAFLQSCTFALPRRRWLRIRRRSRRAGIRKIHLGNLARALGCREISFVRFETRPASKNTVRELLNVGVVVLQCVVVPLAFDGNPILGA